MENIGKFFDNNVDYYSSSHLSKFQINYINFIKNQNKFNANILDIGGGSGFFSNSVLKICPHLDVNILDPSKELLKEVNNPDITKIVGRLPEHLDLDCQFNYIHMASVIHHLTENSIKGSKKLLLESFMLIKDLLKDEGLFFLQDLYYEGYLVSTYPRSLIFYLNQLRNRFNIKIPAKEFINELEVCFYTRNEIKSILERCGFEIVYYGNDEWVNYFRGNKKIYIKKKLLLMKEWGYMAFILKPK